MNPIGMISVAIIVAVEKLLLKPQFTARLVGVATVFAGIITIIQSLPISSAVITPTISCGPGN